MDVVVIDGKSYDVVVESIEESFSILYSENTGRTLSEGARMTLDPLGTFFSHSVKIKPKTGKEEEYDALYEYLSKPRYDGISLKILHAQAYMEYEAYVSNGKNTLIRKNEKSGVARWDGFSANFIPMEAQVTPDE
jgi:hypothetical protein